MRAVGVAPTIVAYNTLLNAHANMGSWAEAMDVLRVVLGSSGEGIHANTATCESCCCLFFPAYTLHSKGLNCRDMTCSRLRHL